MNTPNITCKLENTESVYLGVHISDHVFYNGQGEVQCTFDMLTEIHPGLYTISISNNNVQFVAYEAGLVDVREPIWVREIHPKLVLTRGSESSA